MKLIFLPLLLSLAAPLSAQTSTPQAEWSWSCRLMEPTFPGMTRFGDGGANRVGELLINFDRTNDEVFIEIESETFPHFSAERQLRLSGDVKHEVGQPIHEALPTAYIVQTASGRIAMEVISHGARNGEATAILLSSYMMTTIAGLPEDFFEYHAVGLCARIRDAS